MEDYLKLLIDLHKSAKRQGPGGDEETTKILNLAQLKQAKQLKIADIGCGTGSASISLASQLNAKITAVDILPEFLDVLKDNAENAGVSEIIDTLVCSMDDLPFSHKEYDVIWSEGAIYNMGFEKGVNDWKRYF